MIPSIDTHHYIYEILSNFLETLLSYKKSRNITVAYSG
jgi:hypothetical protein